MSTYVIGDLQGCYDELVALLKKIDYNAQKDTLWFVGDLVNRGPKSLECLRFVKKVCEQGKGKTVLGNHDFHLLGSYCGIKKYRCRSDTLKPILMAKDADDLIDWLRKQPLMIKNEDKKMVMVHAGIPPQWSIDEAFTYATDLNEKMSSEDWKNQLITHFFGSDAKKWHPNIKGGLKTRYIVNALCRMRYCTKDGVLDFKIKTSPKHNTLSEYAPWFQHQNRKNKDYQIFFGHWSTLGSIDEHQVHATDTGCLWGGQLTAYCIETNVRHTLKCQANNS